MEKLFLTDLDVKGKRVLVRADLNVPLDGETITDDGRIQASLETIRWLVDHGARVVLMSHLGRPEGKVVPEMSLRPVARRLGELLDGPVTLAPDCIGPEVAKLAEKLQDGQVLLLENLRFHEGETKKDPEFARALASLGELYVNDAFGTSHRAHSSMFGVTEHVEKAAAGYLLRKEIEYLHDAVAEPKRPFVAVLGGAKVSSKITVIRALMSKVDTLIIGGGMSYTLFRALGREIGGSLLEEDYLDTAREIIEEGKSLGEGRMLLPVDILAADSFSNDADTVVVPADAIPADRQGLDIGPRTIELFCNVVRSAKTVVWNGPMGVFEMPSFAAGTNAVAQALVEATAAGATTIIGGGDSAAAIRKAGLADKVSHVSTGGGASLEYLEGKELPGIVALTDKG